MVQISCTKLLDEIIEWFGLPTGIWLDFEFTDILVNHMYLQCPVYSNIKVL